MSMLGWLHVSDYVWQCPIDRLVLVLWRTDGIWRCDLDGKEREETIDARHLGQQPSLQVAQAEALRWAHETLLALANKAEALRAAMDEAGDG